MDQDRSAIVEELETKLDAGETLILPVTTIIEAGNHIRHIDNGKARKSCAERFTQVLLATSAGKLPWKLHQYTWGPEMLQALAAGGNTGMTFVQHAVGGIGCGDLCILCERDLYAQRSLKQNVQVWTIDETLLSHC
jgi:hypothetical protein